MQNMPHLSFHTLVTRARLQDLNWAQRNVPVETNPTTQTGLYHCQVVLLVASVPNLFLKHNLRTVCPIHGAGTSIKLGFYFGKSAQLGLGKGKNSEVLKHQQL